MLLHSEQRKLLNRFFSRLEARFGNHPLNSDSDPRTIFSHNVSHSQTKVFFTDELGVSISDDEIEALFHVLGRTKFLKLQDLLTVCLAYNGFGSNCQFAAYLQPAISESKSEKRNQSNLNFRLKRVNKTL